MIRRAEERDIERVEELLYQVQDVHAEGRPDYFYKGAKKYTADELKEIFTDDSRPVYVYEDESAQILGYVFLIHQITEGSHSQKDRRTLYIDDLCVDETSRGHHVGTALFEFTENLARSQHFDSLTLNVWECNPKARKFYEKQHMDVLKTTLEKRL